MASASSISRWEKCCERCRAGRTPSRFGPPKTAGVSTSLTKDASKLYVSPGRGKKVAVVDTKTNQVPTSFEVGDRPWGIALSPDEKLLFTANGPAGDVSIVDIATQKVLKKVKAGDRPWG